jgi:hypothetical protein
MILSSEMFSNWVWDIYHIGAVLFLFLIASAVISVAIQSFKLNKNGRTKR